MHLTPPDIAALFVLAMASSAAWLTPTTAPPAIVELRQYTLKPGQRDTLIEVFEREFVESQEATGMAIIGQFRDLDRPDRFVWLRGFADMPSRAKALTDFYSGPVWRAHRELANSTMIDASNVLLLRPARTGSGFASDGPSRPPKGSTASSSGLVVATIYHFDRPVEETFLEFFESSVRPRLSAANVHVAASFITESSPNTFPRLPVREGEHVFVWFATYRSQEDYTRALASLESSAAWRSTAGELERRLKGTPEVLRLQPTSRSQLRAAP